MGNGFPTKKSAFGISRVGGVTVVTPDKAPPEEEAPPATEAGSIGAWCGTLGAGVSSTSSSLMP